MILYKNSLIKKSSKAKDKDVNEDMSVQHVRLIMRSWFGINTAAFRTKGSMAEKSLKK